MFLKLITPRFWNQNNQTNCLSLQQYLEIYFIQFGTHHENLDNEFYLWRTLVTNATLVTLVTNWVRIKSYESNI